MKNLKTILLLLFISSTLGSLSAQNKGLQFDGIDDYLDLGSDAGNNIRTIEMWFKPDHEINPTINNFISLIFRETSLTSIAPNEFGLHFSSLPGSEGKLRFSMNDAAGNNFNVFSDSNRWEANQWYHVAATAHPTRGMKIFIDGVLQSDSNLYNGNTGTSLFTTAVGRWGNANIRYFKGSIDDVKLYTNAIYSADFIPECPDFPSSISDHGTWNLNGTGSVAKDSSIMHYDGTIYGATHQINEICNAGNTLHLDGVNDYVNLGPDAGNDIRTIELWFKPYNEINNSITDFITLTFRETSLTSTAPYEFGLHFSSLPGTEGKLRFSLNDAMGNNYDVFSDSNKWEANKWYHVAAIIHPITGMKLYVDGNIQRDSNIYNGNTGTSIFPTVLGRWGNLGIRYFEGEVDDLKFHTTAVYTSNFIPECPNDPSRIADHGNWNFNGIRRSAIDSNSTRYDGHIVGATRQTEFICTSTITVGLSESNSFDITTHVYPNPTTGLINFELETTHNLSFNLVLIDITGKQLKSINMNTKMSSIDLEDYPNGIYFYQIYHEGERLKAGKIIKH